MEQTAQKKFPNVKAFVSTVPSNGAKGISELRQVIEKVVADLPFLGDEVPASYFQLEKLVAYEATRRTTRPPLRCSNHVSPTYFV